MNSASLCWLALIRYTAAKSVSLLNAVPSGPSSFNTVPKALPAELITPLNVLAPCCPLAMAAANPVTPVPTCFNALPRPDPNPSAFLLASLRDSVSTLTFSSNASIASAVGAVAMCGPCNFVLDRFDHNYI